MNTTRLALRHRHRALLAAALAAGASGALYATDRYWGDPTLIALHALAGWSLALLVPVHVAGVLFTSLRQRENLARAMVTGRKVLRADAVDAVGAANGSAPAEPAPRHPLT